MNIKIVNCLSNMDELSEKIAEAEKIEKDIEKEENKYNTAMQTQFKYLKNDIRFLHENIISTFPYIKVESDEDVVAMKKIIEFVKTAKFCTLTEEQKSNITKALFGLGKGKYAKELQEYSENLSAEDDEYIDGVVDSADIVITSLHNAFHSGKSNPVVDRVFGQYYNLRRFLATNQEEGDYGKAVMKRIVADKEISKEYRDMVKKAYQEYKVEAKFNGIRLGGRIAAGTAGVMAVPVLVAGLAEGIATGIVKLTGDIFQIATNFLALPFDALSMKIQEKSDSKAAKVGAVLVDIPGIALKTVGALTNGILKVGTFVVDTAFNLALLPVNLAMMGVLKLGGVYTKDKIKYADKQLEKNIASILSDGGKKITRKNIAIDNIEVGDNETLVVSGKYFDKDDDIKDYQLTFAASEDVLNKIKFIQEEQIKITENLMAANLMNKLGGDGISYEDFKKLDEQRLDLVFAEATILKNLTSQNPIIKKREIETGIEVEDIEVFDYSNEHNDDHTSADE